MKVTNILEGLKQISDDDVTKDGTMDWATMNEADREQYPEVDEILKVIEKLDEISKNDLVIYRSGNLDEGEFGVGRIVKVPFYGARKYQIHRYGVLDDLFGDKMSVEDRLRTILDSPYSARHVSDTEGLVYIYINQMRSCKKT